MTPLPMSVQTFVETAWIPAINLLGLKDVPEATVMGCAIALQESNLAARRQYNNGPAMGLMQFERGGGVKGVLTHPASEAKARELCRVRGVATDYMSAWKALENDDVLAAGFGRLLLLTDPQPLPKLGDMGQLDVPTVNRAPGAYPYYLRCWRPGKRHDATFPRNYQIAMDYVMGLMS